MSQNKQLTSLIREFYPYAKQYMGFDKDTKLRLADDHKNAEDMLGKTAHYSPRDNEITVFVTNRHPKDILRSISHELVHHKQACDGKFDDLSQMDMGEGYAQSNLYLREMEEEAYLLGNMCFRDWTDQRIQQNSLTEEKKMSKMVKKLEFLAENKKTGVFGDVKVNSKMAKMIVEAHSRLNDKQKTQFESLSIGELVKLVENYISLKKNQAVNESEEEERLGRDEEDEELKHECGDEDHYTHKCKQTDEDRTDEEHPELCKDKDGNKRPCKQKAEDRSDEAEAMIGKGKEDHKLEEETLQEKTFRLQEAGDRLDEIYTKRENLLYEQLVNRWIK